MAVAARRRADGQGFSYGDVAALGVGCVGDADPRTPVSPRWRWLSAVCAVAVTDAFDMADPARPTEVGAGRSDLLEAGAAGAKAAALACEPLSGPPSLCLVFATAGYEQESLLAGVRSVIGRDCLVAGCSGEGVIAGGRSDERARVVGVMAIRSTAIRFAVHHRDDYAVDSVACASALASAVRSEGPDDELAGLLVLIDGIGGDASAFAAALQRGVPASAPVVGGCAGDDLAFERTYQYAGDRVLSDGAVVVSVRGAARFEIATSHGCAPVGLERTITSMRDGWVLALDHRPAWEVLKEYLSADIDELHAEGIAHLSLGKTVNGPNHVACAAAPWVVRTPMQLDRGSGGLFFPGGGLCEGDRVRIVRRDQALIRASGEECAVELARPQRPVFVLQFDCCGRGKVVFGNRASQEIVEPLQRVLAPTVPWLGLHTYGELASLHGELHYHNYTVALCAVYE